MELLKYQELQIGAEDREGKNALLHALRAGGDYWFKEDRETALKMNWSLLC